MKVEIREINEEKIWRESERGRNMGLLVRNKRWEWGLESGVVWERKKGSREWEKNESIMEGNSRLYKWVGIRVVGLCSFYYYSLIFSKSTIIQIIFTY